MCSKPQGSRQGKFRERPTLSLFCKQVHSQSLLNTSALSFCTTQLHCTSVTSVLGLLAHGGRRGRGPKERTRRLSRSFISEPLVSSGAAETRAGREDGNGIHPTKRRQERTEFLKSQITKVKKARRKRRRVFGAGHTSWGIPSLSSQTAVSHNSFLKPLKPGGWRPDETPDPDVTNYLPRAAPLRTAVGLSALAFEAQT